MQEDEEQMFARLIPLTRSLSETRGSSYTPGYMKRIKTMQNAHGQDKGRDIACGEKWTSTDW